ncbi:putative MFS general substrate transporter [Seiridium cardinale]
MSALEPSTAKDDLIQPRREIEVVSDKAEKQNSSIERDEVLPRPPYSVFTPRQQKWAVVIVATAGWFSTASAFIYFPAIPFLVDDLNVSVESINLTVTSYLIGAGIFPTINGSAADRYGRRPVILVSVGVYLVVNIALALQNSFAALFVLRMLQSAAISGTLSIAYGVIGDMVVPAERGGYTGILALL